MWVFDEIRTLAPVLESIATQHGSHIAFGGSVVVKGGSEKDLDIFFYARSSKRFNYREVLKSLTNIGFSDYKIPESVDEVTPYKIVIGSQFSGRRVDIFFLLPP